VGFAGYAIVKDGNTPYLYKLTELGQVGLPQALGITASPTFVGITLSSLAAASTGIVTSSIGGQLVRVAIGSGLSIVGGALVASGSAGTNLSYDPVTRVLASSTGDDVTLPLSTTLAAGLQSAADRIKLDAITVDTATKTIERVRNTTGSEIPKGAVVRIPSPGSSGTTLLVVLADASEESTAANTYGLAQDAIPHNSDGVVITSGNLAGLNTNHLIEGGLVYLSEVAGQTTSTRPTQPAHGVILGWCIKKGPGASGILAIKIANGQELDELHDVLISNPTEDQFLRRSGNLWINETVDLYSTFSAPTGFTVTGSDTTSISLDFAAGYSLPTTAKQGQWDTAYSERNRWDGGPASLDQTTGRTSLGLGSAATRDAGSAAGNVPILDSNALIPSALLPGFVDDVLEFVNLAAFPATGESGKLYVSLATNRQYRWSGSVYVEINPSPGSTDSVPEGSVNLYFTVARASAAAPVQFVAGRQGNITLSVGDVTDAVSTSDPSLTNSREWSAETVSQAEAEAGTSATRRAWTAERVRQSVVSWWNGISSSFGRSFAAANSASAARSLLELGSAALSATSDFVTPSTLTSSLSNKADLVGGVIPTGQIPAIAISDYLGAVNSQSAMLALVGQRGDWCLRTDPAPAAGQWVLSGDDASVIGNWIQIPTASGAVQSVNGQTGVVVLGASDVGAVTQSQLNSYALLTDSRFTDQRTPTDGSVTTEKITSSGLSTSSINPSAMTPWAPDTNYQRNALVEYGGVGYARISPGTSGSTFNPASWCQVTPGARSVYAVGNYIIPARGSAGTGSALNTGSIYFHPFTVERAITVGAIMARVTTIAANSNFQIAIYGSSGGEPIGAPIGRTGNLAGTVATTVSGNVIAQFNLFPGVVYYWGVMADAGVGFTYLAGSSLEAGYLVGSATPGSLISASTSTLITRLLGGQTFGTWPTLTAGQTSESGGTRGVLPGLQIAGFPQ
jgi:hypothetical protein